MTVTSSEPILKVLVGSKKKWTALEIVAEGFPLTTGLKRNDPRHAFYISLYEERSGPWRSCRHRRGRCGGWPASYG